MPYVFDPMRPTVSSSSSDPCFDLFFGDPVEVALDLVAVVDGDHGLRLHFGLARHAADQGHSRVGCQLRPQVGVEQGVLLSRGRVEVMLGVERRKPEDLVGHRTEVVRQRLGQKRRARCRQGFNAAQVYENVVVDLYHIV